MFEVSAKIPKFRPPRFGFGGLQDETLARIQFRLGSWEKFEIYKHLVEYIYETIRFNRKLKLQFLYRLQSRLRLKWNLAREIESRR